ncbi:MAG: phosphate butyryltransferase [Lachnospiraceae bacterium]|nr:phosphate butyryltransferase [Lachnospiraceae bacterium]
MIHNFQELLEKAKAEKTRTVSVAAAADPAVLETIRDATRMGLIQPILVGDGEKIDAIAAQLSFHEYRLVDASGEEDAVEKAVRLVHDREAEVLMKGLVNTSTYMRGILNKEWGLRTGRLLSLLAVYEHPGYHKLLYCSDSGINVAPDLMQKKDIMTNALLAMKNLGLENPKTAILAANEMPNDKIAASYDAVRLVEMVKNGEIPSCIAEGPLSFDITFDKHAAEHKGFASEVSGDPDFLVFPSIEAGNILGKSWLYFDHAKWAGIVLGASAPAILGSRSDTPEIKINSIALACMAADKI